MVGGMEAKAAEVLAAEGRVKVEHDDPLVYLTIVQEGGTGHAAIEHPVTATLHRRDWEKIKAAT